MRGGWQSFYSFNSNMPEQPTDILEGSSLEDIKRLIGYDRWDLEGDPQLYGPLGEYREQYSRTDVPGYAMEIIGIEQPDMQDQIREIRIYDQSTYIPVISCEWGPAIYDFTGSAGSETCCGVHFYKLGYRLNDREHWESEVEDGEWIQWEKVEEDTK